MHAHAKKLLLFRIVGDILFDGFENFGELGAEENGNDGRGRFVRTESVVVPCARDGDA